MKRNPVANQSTTPTVSIATGATEDSRRGGYRGGIPQYQTELSGGGAGDRKEE